MYKKTIGIFFAIFFRDAPTNFQY
ncbi:hypothetical protein [uncultured Flavobacterium sp.]